MLAFRKRPESPNPDPVAAAEVDLEAAQAAHLASQDAAAKALAAFDADPSRGSEDALVKAQEGVTRAALHVGRCERLLASAQATAADERRARLQAELLELERQLDHETVQRLTRPLLAAEVDCLIALTRARVARTVQERHLDDLAGAAERLRQQLSMPPSGRHSFVLYAAANVVEDFRRIEWSTPVETRAAEAVARELSR